MALICGEFLHVPFIETRRPDEELYSLPASSHLAHKEFAPGKATSDQEEIKFLVIAPCFNSLLHPDLYLHSPYRLLWPVLGYYQFASSNIS